MNELLHQSDLYMITRRCSLRLMRCKGGHEPHEETSEWLLRTPYSTSIFLL